MTTKQDELEPLRASIINKKINSSNLDERSKLNKSTGENYSIKMISKKERLLLFCLLVYGIIIFGVSAASLGISIKEFSLNMNVQVDDIAYGLSVISFFACIGAVLTFFTLDRWNRQLQLAFFSFFFALVTICYPFITSYKFYIFIQSISGICVTYINSISNVWVVELFQGYNPKTYLQIMHLSFTIGEMVTPFLFAPFLRDLKNTTLTNNSTNLTKNLTTTPTTIVLQSLKDENQDDGFSLANLFKTAKESDLWIPYMILGIAKISICIFIIVAYIIKPYKKLGETRNDDSKISNDQNVAKYSNNKSDDDCSNESQEYEIFDNNIKHDLSKIYYIVFMFLVCLIAGIQLTNELNAISLLPTYLIESELKLDQKTASYSQSILSASILVGRGVNILLTLIISVQSMIFLNYISMIAGNVMILLTVREQSVLLVNIGIALVGYGFSNCYPMFLTLVDEKVTLKNKSISLIMLTGGVFQTITPALLGKFLTTNTSYFVLLNIAITSFALLIYIILVLLETIRLRNKKL